MAKNITLMGANYPDVPAVDLPQTGGGTARFYDINVIDNLNSDSSTDALSAKQGKVLDSNSFHVKGAIGNTDINTIKGESAQGVYALGGGNTNIPSSANWGTLIVTYSYGGTHQLAFNSNGIWVRSYTGSPLAWTVWKAATINIVP